MLQLESLSCARRLALQTLGAVVGVLLVAGFLLYSERTLIMNERQAAVRPRASCRTPTRRVPRWPR